ALDDPPEHVVLRLVGDEAVEAHLIGDLEGFLDLVCAPLGDPHVEDLALTDEVVEGPEGLLERCGVVEPVRLVQVQVVGADTAQGVLGTADDVLTGQAPCRSCRRSWAKTPWRRSPGRRGALPSTPDRGLPRPCRARRRRRCRKW